MNFRLSSNECLMAEGFSMGENLHIFLMYTVHQRELSKHGEKVLGKHFFPLSTKYCLLFHFVLTSKSTIIPTTTPPLGSCLSGILPVLYYTYFQPLSCSGFGDAVGMCWWDLPRPRDGRESYTTALHEAIFWRMVHKGAVKDVIFILWFFSL